MGKGKGKKFTNKNKARTKEGGPKPKRRSLPKPLRRRGCERIRWDMGGSLSHEGKPPQALPKEGMCLAGYGLLGVGEI